MQESEDRLFGIGHLERTMTFSGGMTSSRGAESMLNLTLLPFSDLLSCLLWAKLEVREQGSLLIQSKQTVLPGHGTQQKRAEDGFGMTNGRNPTQHNETVFKKKILKLKVF